MDEIPQNQPTQENPPPFAPVMPAPASQPPAPGTPAMKKKIPLLGILIVLVIIIALGAGGFAAGKLNLLSNPKPPNPTPRPTITPTPTPTRQLSVIASQSAFLQLETNISSLSGSIQNAIIQDPSLTPPSLDLPLGFGN